MITSAKNYTKKPPKNGQTEPQDKWEKQSYIDKITQRSIHIHTHKKIKRKKEIYIFKKKEESKHINNLPVIISSKY